MDTEKVATNSVTWQLPIVDHVVLIIRKSRLFFNVPILSLLSFSSNNIKKCVVKDYFCRRLHSIVIQSTHNERARSNMKKNHH